MIAPPRSFRTMGQRLSVEVVPAGVGMNMSDPTALGTTFHDEGKVRIRAAGSGGLSGHQQVDTFLHEALHAIISISGMRAALHLDHDDKEERLICALCPQILLLLRDNPRVVSYLTQRLP